jgi:hypothetical protein
MAEADRREALVLLVHRLNHLLEEWGHHQSGNDSRLMARVDLLVTAAVKEGQVPGLAWDPVALKIVPVGEEAGYGEDDDAAE